MTTLTREEIITKIAEGIRPRRQDGFDEKIYLSVIVTCVDAAIKKANIEWCSNNLQLLEELVEEKVIGPDSIMPELEKMAQKMGEKGYVLAPESKLS